MENAMGHIPIQKVSPHCFGKDKSWVRLIKKGGISLPPQSTNPNKERKAVAKGTFPPPEWNYLDTT